MKKMSRMKNTVEKYNKFSNGTQILITSTATAIPLYFAAFLSVWIADISKATGGWKVLTHAVVIIVSMVIIGAIWRYFNHVRGDICSDENKMMQLKNLSYLNIDRYVLQNSRNAAASGSFKTESFYRDNVASKDMTERVIRAAYNAFEATYGQETKIAERIDFEVTYMTVSYIDNEITIVAWANRANRIPRSMTLRRNNHGIYGDTVTASIYREDGPKIHIIESTIKRNAKYTSLYDGQLERIKSSIVYPVLSTSNMLLGTIVVHCDENEFFQNTKEKYWTDIMEIYAIRIANNEMKMQMAYKESVKQGRIEIQLPQHGERKK